MKELIEAFKALRHAPRAFWLCIFAFSFDAIAYFGILPLMKAFIGQDLGVAPSLASTWVSLFAGAVSLFMIFIGKPMESRLGIRGAIILALALAFGGRVLYSSAPYFGGLVSLAISLVVVALGEGLLQPMCYAGVKRYTTEETSAMGFALVYAGLNLGAMLMGPLSAKVRTTFDVPYNAGESKLSGFNAVNWMSTGFTLVTLVVFALLMTKAVEARGARAAAALPIVEKEGAADREPAREPRAVEPKSPFRDARFLFFIFALLPVRTLFAHQWLTMPEYVLRAYPKEVADRMELFVDSINPLVVFFGVPMIAALTKRYHVLTMMILGSFVSASSTFLLVGGVHTWALFLYFVVFSVGESLWSSRFYEYAASIAPEGRVAQYMGVASLPWFVAKATTGFYSGWVLERFVPAGSTSDGSTMWLLYGLFALVSPASLFLARKWVRSGMATKTA